MWNEIITSSDLAVFMQTIDYFHDSCLKEMHYVSGAYVTENLLMHPINDCRLLRVVLQCQSRRLPMIELEFEGLRYLKLFPADSRFTSEILDATLILRDDYIVWCDCGGLSEADIEDYSGTVICAKKFRWRIVHNTMGSCEFYSSNQ